MSWGRSEGKRLTANLVESVRVDDKPRKRHIASLASIREREIDDVRYRCRFWDQVTRKLNHLRERVSAGDRRDIEGLLAERVPCPTRKQHDQCKYKKTAYRKGQALDAPPANSSDAERAR